jgi:putative CocE/NonD family hydrolase
MAHGPRDVTARHWLVIGPWDHSGTRRPKAELGGVSFGPGAVMSMEALHKAWYDHVLKGGPRPELLKERVACFVMDRNKWIHAPDLRRIEGPPLRLELDAAGAAAGDVTRSGRLADRPPAAAASVTLTADPRYLPPRERIDAENPAFLRDQQDAYTDLRSQVAWHSAPLAAELVLAGRPRVRLQVAVDQPDADLYVDLAEVLPDGSAIVLSRSAVRLRYRKGTAEAAPMVPGRPEPIDVPGMNFFARAIGRGSRLRLVVNAGPSFGWQRNLHTGGDPAAEPMSRARVAKITLMTGPGSGSALELPRPDDGVMGPRDEPAPPR